MYQTYMMVTEAYCQSNHSVASVTEPESIWSPYDGHFTSNNKEQVSQWTSPNASTAFQKLSTKRGIKRRNEKFNRILNNHFLTCYIRGFPQNRLRNCGCTLLYFINLLFTSCDKIKQATVQNWNQTTETNPFGLIVFLLRHLPLHNIHTSFTI